MIMILRTVPFDSIYRCISYLSLKLVPEKHKMEKVCGPVLSIIQNTLPTILSYLSKEVLESFLTIKELIDPLSADNLHMKRTLYEGFVVTGFGSIPSTTEVPNFSTLDVTIGEFTLFFMKPRSLNSFLQDLDVFEGAYKWSYLIFGSVAGVISGMIIVRYWEYQHERKSFKKLEENLAAARRLERLYKDQLRDIRENQLCVICHVNLREIILLPCGHVCLCLNCSYSIINHCPICRQKIKLKNSAYIT